MSYDGTIGRQYANSLPLRKVVTRWYQPNGLVWRNVRGQPTVMEAIDYLTPCVVLECGHRLALVAPKTKAKRCHLCGPRDGYDVRFGCTVAELEAREAARLADIEAHRAAAEDGR